METKTSDPQLKRMSTNPQEPPGVPRGRVLLVFGGNFKIVSAASEPGGREPVALLKPGGGQHEGSGLFEPGSQNKVDAG